MAAVPHVNEPTDISSASFREIMALFPTGVAIVTSDGPTGPSGLTVNALCSVSLQPLLVMAALDVTSRTLPAIRTSRRFGVNFLKEHHHEWSTRFATKLPEPDKFAHVPHLRNHDVPLIRDAHAWLVCKVAAIYPGGDHAIVVGEVVALGRHETPSSPLVFYDGRYTRLDGGDQRIPDGSDREGSLGERRRMAAKRRSTSDAIPARCLPT
jgi:flavin reductase (DIM6/NTAB) family NADH-FMN oxidoreductase RutF